MRRLRRPSRSRRRFVEFALEARDALAHAPAIDFETLLAGAAPPDAAAESRQPFVALGESRQSVLQLRQLDLQLAVSRARALGEDVEDQLRAVDHAQFEPLGDVACLRGREIVVEDHEVGVVLEGQHDEVFEAPRADDRARIDLRPHLHQHVRNLDACRTRQLAQLVDGLLGVVSRATGAHRHQHGAIARADRTGARGTGQLFFERTDPVLEVEVEQRRRTRRHALDHGAVQPGGTQVRDVRVRRHAGRVHSERHHRVEAELGEVGQVVVGQRLVAEEGVDAAESAQASLTSAQAPPLGHLDRGSAAHHRVRDGTASIDEDTHLASDLVREFGEFPRKFLGHETATRKPAPIQALEGSNLAGLEALCVAEDLDASVSSMAERSPRPTPSSARGPPGSRRVVRALLNRQRVRRPVDAWLRIPIRH